MKIMLYIDTLYYGGAQRVMANIANYLNDAGHEVILVNDFPAERDIEEYFLCPEIRREYLCPNNLGNHLIKNVKRISKLRELVNLHSVQIILSFLGRPNIRMLLATIGLPMKKVVSVRNDPNREYGAGGIKKWFAQNLFKLADGCVFQTEDAASYFPKSVRKKSTIILNPVDVKFFEVQRSDSPRNIITVGRMEPQKNQKLLIQAFYEIVKEFAEEKLIIYGEGPLRQELTEQCRTLGILERVEMPGNVFNIENVLAEAKVFVLPSDYEGMPNALMEAMAVGVPCISTDCPCGGPRTLITDEMDGCLVPCGDEQALTDELRKILKCNSFQDKLEEKARQKAETFQPNKIFSEWEEFLLKKAKF